MNNQYDKIALCAHVEQGQVRYYKEYYIGGRIVRMEEISCAEFVRLLNPNTQSVNEVNKPSGRN